MKTIILAGGLGTRLAEETEVKPKPMVEIGGRPILWHLLKYYAHFGFNEFYIALGYKGEVIKRYLADYAMLNGDLSVSTLEGRIHRHDGMRDDWTVHLMETGIETITGGRIKRLAQYVSGGTFMMTYGDGLASVDLRALVDFHRSHGRLATVTAVRPPARFGGLEFDGDRVSRFTEKPLAGEGWINGGFFVLEPGVLDYIEGDGTHWELEPVEQLARDGELMVFRHDAFWQCMDTLRDMRLLESLWSSGAAPWKVWE